MKTFSFGDPLQAMFDRNRKTEKDNFGRKRKANGCIYLTGSDLRESEGHLSIRSCYNMLSSILPPELENILTNRNCTDSALLEK